MNPIMNSMGLPRRVRLPLGGAALAVAAAVVITLALAWPALRQRAVTEPPPRAAAPVRAIVAAAPGWVDAEGGIQRLGVRTEGTIERVVVHDGDHVRAGAVLLSLDEHQSALDREGAQLDIERLQQQFASLGRQLSQATLAQVRLQPLVQQQAEPADELRAAEARVAELRSQQQAAEIDLRAARLRLKAIDARQVREQLRAPSDGEVLRVLAHAGDAAAPGTPQLWFVAAGPRLVRAEIDERLFGQVRAGMRAEVSPEYDDQRIYKARVLRVAAAVGPVQALPELRAAAKDDRVVECVLSVEGNDLLIGQRVQVNVLGGH